VTTEKKDSVLPEYAFIERRELLKGIGLSDEAIQRIQIGVVSSWGELNPAAVNLKRVTEAVKAGIWAAGGTPREFVISSICTSMGGADNFHLPHRDLVAGYIEAAAATNLFDGLVFIPVCDDVVPAHLMAAARLDLPSIVVSGGYMLLNRYKGVDIDPFDVPAKYYTRFKEGEIDSDEFKYIEDLGCAGSGACPAMATANTMAAMSEALGMALPGNASLPGADSRLIRLAFRAGLKVVELHKKGIKPSAMMTLGAFRNAIRVLMAVGGSTNTVLHLQAIASELDLNIDIDEFNTLSRETPFICNIAPSGSAEYNLKDLDEAGGIQAVMKELEPLLDTSVKTATGNSLGDNLQNIGVRNRSVIYPLREPIAKEGGLVFLRGNLATQGAIVKQSAVPPEMLRHRGPARVFPDEDEACSALMANGIAAGDVVIVRYKGPRGDPGMRISHRFLWLLSALGLERSIAFITDGRLSGSNKCCAVAHVTPEATEGGPLAIIRDGDIIEIDIPDKKLNIDISSEELENRLNQWRRPEKKVTRGYLAIYSKLAKSADKGASLNYEQGLS